MKSLCLYNCLLFILLVCSCRKQDLESALSYAGDNRPELEKVLRHYQNDPMKLQAAEFLIENMPYHAFPQSEELNEYYRKQDSIATLVERRTKTTPLQDSLFNLLKRPSLENALWTNDVHYIKSGFLIKHIDRAFKAWKNPWNDELTFKEFCEYMLPYRIGREMPVDNYQFYRDSICRMAKKGLFYCVYTRKDLQRIFVEVMKKYKTKIVYQSQFPGGHEPWHLVNMRRATCEETAELGVHIFHSLGIPTVLDHVPQWANRSMGHSWNVFMTERDSVLDFGHESSDILGQHLKQRTEKYAKVYRRTFAAQPDLLKMIREMKDVPSTFSSPCNKDVTEQYLPDCMDVEAKLDGMPWERPDYVFLCTFDNREWVPVQWAKTGLLTATFTKMGRGIAYLPAYYEDGKMIPAAPPFVLTQDGQMIQMVADTLKKAEMTLRRKYPRVLRMDMHAREMIGSVIEASNTSDFSKATTLMTVRNTPGDINDSLLTSDKKFRYVRWKMKDENIGNLAEISFYGKRTVNEEEKILSGKVFGFPEPAETDKHPYRHAIDSIPGRYFSKPKNTVGYVGLDLGAGNEAYITRAHFHPRSDTNFILIGDTYELCYWNNGCWNSVGTQVANTHELVFKDVPQGTLYLLHNLTKGKEERIFTYENGKQVWW